MNNENNVETEDNKVITPVEPVTPASNPEVNETPVVNEKPSSSSLLWLLIAVIVIVGGCIVFILYRSGFFG